MQDTVVPADADQPPYPAVAVEQEEQVAPAVELVVFAIVQVSA